MSHFKELEGDKYKSNFAEISQKLGTRKSAKTTDMRVRKKSGAEIVENYHPKREILKHACFLHCDCLSFTKARLSFSVN